jgi:hypothetical protein
MIERIIKHYDPPVEFHKSLPGSTRITLMKRYDDGIPDGYEPPKRKKVPQVRNARNEPIDDDVGKPAKKGNNMTYDRFAGFGDPITKREMTGDTAPFYRMIDRQALALQAQTGMSYASAFTKCYTDPSNRSIVDAATREHIAKGLDDMFGYRLATPVKKAGAPMDAVQDDLDASRRGDPGSARAELHRRVGDHMKANPGLSYERAFTAIYLHPNNRSLKDRVDMESVMHARSLSPQAKPFPRYSSPGHRGVNAASNVGREGKGGEDF